MQYKTYEVSIEVYGKPGAEVIIVSDTSEQKIYNKFLRLGIIAKGFKEIQLSSTGEQNVVNLY